MDNIYTLFDTSARVGASIKKVKLESARQLLNLCAYLAPEGIPLSLLREGRAWLPLPLRGILMNTPSLNNAVSELTAHSLVRKQGGLLYMRRLTQEAVRQELIGDTSWLSYCLDMVSSIFKYKYGNRYSRSIFKQSAPHVLELARHGEALLGEDEEAQKKMALLFYKAGCGFHFYGQYPEALEWFGKASLIQERVIGAEHRDTAATYNNIAGVYDSQGNYIKALEWYGKSLSIYENALGTEHADTAAAYNNIALVYKNLREYDQALKWYRKALAITEKVLGAQHPDTAATYNNIAVVYDSVGDSAKALEWYNKALAIREKTLGPDHPDTSGTYNNIALVYSSRGEYARALEWYRKALVIKEKVLGTEHPSTATTYNNIALVYYSQGGYDQALEWYDKSYKIYLQKLGETHPHTSLVKNNMANCLAKIRP